MRTRTARLGACLVLLSCSDATGPAGDGSITVFANTQGGDPDLDGYDLRIDGEFRVALSSQGNVTLTLSAGSHRLELEGMAPNCGVPEGARREVEVTAGGSGSLLFGQPNDLALGACRQRDGHRPRGRLGQVGGRGLAHVEDDHER